MSRSRLAAFLAAFLGACLAFPSAGEAGTVETRKVRVTDGRGYAYARILVYRAAVGERNDLRVLARGDYAFVRDKTGVVPKGGCRQRTEADPTTAVCDFSEVPRLQDYAQRARQRRGVLSVNST